MRVADSTTVRNYLGYLDQAKTNYATTNLRIASGERFSAISDDVSAGTRVLRVRDQRRKCASRNGYGGQGCGSGSGARHAAMIPAATLWGEVKRFTFC